MWGFIATTKSHFTKECYKEFFKFLLYITIKTKKITKTCHHFECQVDMHKRYAYIFLLSQLKHPIK